MIMEYNYRCRGIELLISVNHVISLYRNSFPAVPFVSQYILPYSNAILSIQICYTQYLKENELLSSQFSMKSSEESVFTAWWLLMAWCLFGTKASAATLMANTVL